MKTLIFKSLYNTVLFHYIKKYYSFIIGLFDAIISVSFFLLSVLIIKLLVHPYMTLGQRHYIFIAFLIPTLIILLKVTNVSKIPRTGRYLSIFFDFVRFTLLLSALCFLFVFIFKLKAISIYVISLYLTINHFGLFFFRIITYRVFKDYRISGYNFRNVLVIADENSDEIIEKILNNKEWGFRVLFILSDSDKIRDKFGLKSKIYPNNVNIKKLLDIDIIDEVIYCRSEIDAEYLQKIVITCKEVGVTFRLQNELSPLSIDDGILTKLEDIPMLTVMNTPKNEFAIIFKTILESIFAFIALLFLSPFLLLIGLLIKLDSKGSVFFKQKRVGLRGRQFYIYKFRTMVVNAEEIKEKLQVMNEADGPTFKIKNDPRITRIGRFLRKTSMDEIPQLINVLKGEMALVGPRPPIPREVDDYERWQLRRLSVKPGLTCTWQITPNRNDVKFEKWVKLDLHYIDTWSLKKDAKIFLKTVKAVVANKGY